jgi:hypothetical protein
MRSAWITLTMHSDLQTAYHDHIFVPIDLGMNAMAQLILLQERAREGILPEAGSLC